MTVSGEAKEARSVQTEARDFLYRYARVVDERRYLDWVDLFTEDATYSGITHENEHDQGLYLFKDEGKEALKVRAAWLIGLWQVERGKTLHTVTNIDVTDVAANEVRTRSYFVIYRTGDDGITQFHACGEYHDILVQQDGRWLFRERKAIVDANTLPPAFTELL